MLSYRAESALYNIMTEFYKSTPKEGRVILKEIFTILFSIAVPVYQKICHKKTQKPATR